MAVAQRKPSAAPLKDLYDIGEVPPLGHVPANMHAWAIRKERHGPPEKAMQQEVVPTWPIAEDEVLVYVMAGGVNYNGVWAGLGIPVSPLDGHKHPFHIAGSDASRLVWGASGGLGVFGVQLVAASGANAIGIVSDPSKVQYVMDLGAKGVINRSDFKCWGAMPKVGTPEYDIWVKEARRFGKAIWNITGKHDVDIVFEHPGEATFPVSCLVVKRGGMVVFCAGTSGYNITFDARYVWMRQKRIQGSHFAHLKQASAANQFVIDRRIDPCMSDVFPWEKIPYAHELMRTNRHKPGNMAVLVNAPRPGLRNLEDVIEAAGAAEL